MESTRLSKEIGLDFAKLMHGIVFGQERACVILSAVLLDARLEIALKKVLRPSRARKPANDEIFGANAPIGTFSSKILLAYRLGLIDNQVKSSLESIRKIRNEFAHSTEHQELSQEPNKDQILELKNLAKDNPIYKSTYQAFRKYKNLPGIDGFTKMSPDLTVFLASIAAITASLHIITEDNQIANFEQIATFRLIVENE